jgi:hypothetical protein
MSIIMMNLGGAFAKGMTQHFFDDFSVEDHSSSATL